MPEKGLTRVKRLKFRMHHSGKMKDIHAAEDIAKKHNLGFEENTILNLADSIRFGGKANTEKSVKLIAAEGMEEGIKNRMYTIRNFTEGYTEHGANHMKKLLKFVKENGLTESWNNGQISGISMANTLKDRTADEIDAGLEFIRKHGLLEHSDNIAFLSKYANTPNGAKTLNNIMDYMDKAFEYTENPDYHRNELRNDRWLSHKFPRLYLGFERNHYAEALNAIEKENLSGDDVYNPSNTFEDTPYDAQMNLLKELPDLVHEAEMNATLEAALEAHRKHFPNASYQYLGRMGDLYEKMVDKENLNRPHEEAKKELDKLFTTTKGLIDRMKCTPKKTRDMDDIYHGNALWLAELIDEFDEYKVSAALRKAKKMPEYGSVRHGNELQRVVTEGAKLLRKEEREKKKAE